MSGNTTRTSDLSNVHTRRSLPAAASRGLLGAELTCRLKATEVVAMLKEAWRAILAFLKSCSAIGCVAAGRGTAATFTVFSAGDKCEVDNY